MFLVKIFKYDFNKGKLDCVCQFLCPVDKLLKAIEEYPGCVIELLTFPLYD